MSYNVTINISLIARETFFSPPPSPKKRVSNKVNLCISQPSKLELDFNFTALANKLKYMKILWSLHWTLLVPLDQKKNMDNNTRIRYSGSFMRSAQEPQHDQYRKSTRFYPLISREKEIKSDIDLQKSDHIVRPVYTVSTSIKVSSDSILNSPTDELINVTLRAICLPCIQLNR